MNSPFARIKKIQEFLDEGDFHRQPQEAITHTRRIAHFWVLVFRSFQKNRGPVRAASLAYTTLLALIPMLAVVVSVSTGFLQNEEGKDTIRNLTDKFVETIAPQLNLIESDDLETASINRAEAVNRIHEYINKINSGTLGLTAGIALVFIAVTVLSTIESTFNDIWGVSQGRSWSARIVQYWAAITLGPLFIVSAVALTASSAKEDVESAVASAAAETNAVPVVQAENLEETSIETNAAPAEPEKEPDPALAAQDNIGSRFMNRFMIPFFVLSVFLMLVYKLMPATQVMWAAAAVGGIFGGCVLQLNSLFSVIYVSRVVTYSKIYGGLGVVPIMLVGLYFSWLIVLLGAQVAYAYQNKKAYVQEKQAESINQRGREFVALRLMTYIATEFYSGNNPPTALKLSTDLCIPSQLVTNLLDTLVKLHLLVEVQGEEAGYSPAKPIDQITEEDVLAALRSGHGTEISTADDPGRAIVREEYDRIQNAEMHAAGSVTLQTLVLRQASLSAVAKPEPAAVGS